MSLDKFTNNTRIIGRKRVIPNCLEPSSVASLSPSTPLKRLNSGSINLDDTNRLEALPQDVLVRILCKVDHSDLGQLLLVSRLVNEAATVAKKQHFAYRTPLATTNRIDEKVHRNAPLQNKVAKFRLDPKKLTSLAVVLFASPDD